MGTKSIVCFILALIPIVLSNCPESKNTLRRIGNTRYYIIQNTEQKGGFVTIDQARKDCSKHGLKLATIKNLLSLAVVGRQLETMVFKELMKDTWYWLDARYNMKSQKYHWGDNVKDQLQYTLFLYRDPRPIGVSSHITYNNVYQKHEDKPQCLTIALPWLGSADHYANKTVFFGHQTSFDERDCQSWQKRHAMCEASTEDCKPVDSYPFILDEEKHEYFETGNWIFGDRKYIINWKQQTFNESERYCKSLGLQLMNAGALEKFLIPHMKMWTREITASQFWTGMSYLDESKQYKDSFGNVIANENTGVNFTDSTFKSRSSKISPVFCVALSLAYELQSQMPCSNPSSQNCQWSFIKYAPANCNNYHGTICQHSDYDAREIKWYLNFKTNLDDILSKAALTTEFGYKLNNFVLRSKYKQTFGVCYCPKGYRMIRSHKNTNLVWSVKPTSTEKEIYKYDYTESYWMVDKDLFNKTMTSKCTLSYAVKGTRKFKEISCTDWHFYLCERLGKRPTRAHNIRINKSPPMLWKEGPQPRLYPLLRSEPDEPCFCKLKDQSKEYNTVVNRCINDEHVGGCSTLSFEENGFCQRKGEHIFYAISGTVCGSKKENDLCKIERLVYAINFGGGPHTDDRGILFDKLSSSTENYWHVKPKLWVEGKSKFEVKDVPASDVELYKTWASGEWFSLNKSRSVAAGCAVLSFTTFGDGYYEITMKTGELWWEDDKRQNRTFNVILNGIYI